MVVVRVINKDTPLYRTGGNVLDDVRAIQDMFETFDTILKSKRCITLAEVLMGYGLDVSQESLIAGWTSDAYEKVDITIQIKRSGDIALFFNVLNDIRYTLLSETEIMPPPLTAED